MKRMRKLLSVLLALIILFILCACGETNEVSEKISKEEIERELGAYEGDVAKIFESYGITYETITLDTIETIYETQEPEYGLASCESIIESKSFCNLTGVKALELLDSLVHGECSTYAIDDDRILCINPSIKNGDDIFKYNNDSIDNTTQLLYSNKYVKDVVVVAVDYNDTVVFNKFDNMGFRNVKQDDYDNERKLSQKESTITEATQPTTQASDSNGLGKKVKDGTKKDNIWACAQDIATQSLKSPSTAEFCPVYDATVYHQGGKEYMIKGYVDAQNSYGAIVRINFAVWLTYTGEGYKNGYVEFEE